MTPHAIAHDLVNSLIATVPIYANELGSVGDATEMRQYTTPLVYVASLTAAQSWHLKCNVNSHVNKLRADHGRFHFVCC